MSLRDRYLRPVLFGLSLTVTVAAIGAACSRDGAADAFTALNYDTHKPRFPLNGSAHQGIDCQVCHGAFGTFTQFDCLTGCHAQADTDPAHGGVPDYGYSSDKCYACHPDGVGVDHEKYFPIASGRHSGIACTQCHTDPTNHKVFSCIESPCHSKGQTDGHHGEVGDYSYDSAACYRCHPRGRGG